MLETRISDSQLSMSRGAVFMVRVKRVEDEHLKSGKTIPKMTYVLGDEEAIPITRKSTDCGFIISEAIDSVLNFHLAAHHVLICDQVQKVNRLFC